MDENTTYDTTPVCLDELVTVWGEYDTRTHWNGFLCPRLDAWACERVLDALDAAYRHSGEEVSITHEWADDGTLVIHETYGPDTDTPGEDAWSTDYLTPNDDGLYALGAYGWTWSADEDDGAEDAANRGVGNPISPTDDRPVCEDCHEHRYDLTTRDRHHGDLLCDPCADTRDAELDSRQDTHTH